MSATATHFIVVDLETTGLESRKDAIIEVGLVHCAYAMGEMKVLETFESLVNPGRHLDFLIEKITGISNDMLKDARSWSDVKPEIVAFIGDLPLVAHNADFDMGFLDENGVDTKTHSIYDTYWLSTLLVPEATSYDLGYLCEFFKVMNKQHHRALNDAEVTAQVFGQLLDRFDTLDSQSLRNVKTFIEDRNWSYATLLPAKGKRAEKDDATEAVVLRQFANAQELHDHPLAIDNKALNSVFAAKGHLSKQFASYEERPQQTEMAVDIAGALTTDNILAIEAGTGVGKSLAYLVPAAQLALQNNTQVVIATFTLNLQDQLVDKDIPVVVKAMAKSFADPPLSYAILKGRDHYLCSRRLKYFLKRQNLSDYEVSFAVKLLLALPRLVEGVKQEISLSRAEYRLWGQVNAASEFCYGQHCDHSESPCFYAKAWKAAKNSHLIVTNHAFLFSNQQLAGTDFPFVIIDEAHHLEDVISDQNTQEFDEFQFKEWLSGFGQKKGATYAGLLGELQVYGAATKTDNLEDLSHISRLVQQLNKQHKHLAKFLLEILQPAGTTAGLFAAKKAPTEAPVGDWDRNKRITGAIRESGAWLEIEKLVETIAPSLVELVELLTAQLPDDQFAKTDLGRTVKEQVQSQIDQASFFRQVLQQAILTPRDNEFVTYLRLDPRLSSVAVRVVPLEAGKIFHDDFLVNKRAVILTSATLFGSSDEYLTRQLNLVDLVTCKRIASPFDYPRQAQLYIPSDLPHHHDGEFESYLGKQLKELVKLHHGRAMVLFTSYAQLKRMHQKLLRELDEIGIEILSQGIVGSRAKIVRAFKKNPSSVIFGTNSFWEGVDFPGDELKTLVIVKLPFDVPSDPIFAARSEKFENAFTEYSLPRAVLRFKQGFGRLIRTKTDTGIVAILDKRIVGSGYGKEFLKALPEGMKRIAEL